MGSGRSGPLLTSICTCVSEPINITHALVCIKIFVLLVLRQSITIIIRTNQRNLSNCTQNEIMET